MGSTNGTFVNGEKKIAGSPRSSHEGDRILVGTIDHQGGRAVEGSVAQQTEAEARRRLEAGAQQRQQTQGRPMSGVIEEIPLPDLLQLLSTSRKSGVLTINNGVSIGKIYLRKGAIYFATINDDFAVSPQKAIYRMLTRSTGTIELEPRVEIQVMEEIQESTEGLLHARASASSTKFGNRCKESSLRRSVRSPSGRADAASLAGKLRDLTPSELDTFQLVLDHGQLQKVLDNFPGTDLDAAQNIIALMKREFVVSPLHRRRADHPLRETPPRRFRIEMLSTETRLGSFVPRDLATDPADPSCRRGGGITAARGRDRRRRYLDRSLPAGWRLRGARDRSAVCRRAPAARGPVLDLVRRVRAPSRFDRLLVETPESDAALGKARDRSPARASRT